MPPGKCPLPSVSSLKYVDDFWIIQPNFQGNYEIKNYIIDSRMIRISFPRGKIRFESKLFDKATKKMVLCVNAFLEGQ